MEHGGQLGPGKRARLDKWTSRDILQYWDENGRVDGDIAPTFELPLLTKLCPGRSRALPGILLVWPEKWGENAEEEVGDLA